MCFILHFFPYLFFILIFLPFLFLSFYFLIQFYACFLQIKWIVNVVQSNEQLNRECSLFTDDERYVIVGSAAHIPDDLRPHFYQV